MIVPMKHLDLVCVASERNATLERLRALGAVHLDLSSAASAPVAAAEGDLADAEKAAREKPEPPRAWNTLRALSATSLRFSSAPAFSGAPKRCPLPRKYTTAATASSISAITVP